MMKVALACMVSLANATLSPVGAERFSVEAGPEVFWRQVEEIRGVIALGEDSSGNVWAADGYKVSVFPPGGPDRPKAFPVTPAGIPGSVKSFAKDRKARFCLGVWNGGSVFCHEGSAWSAAIPDPGEHLHAVGLFQDQVYAAAQTLKRWDPERRSWQPVGATQGRVFDYFHETPWGAFFAGGPALWVLNEPAGSGWRSFWSGSGKSQEWVTSIDSTADGRVLVGTKNGLFVLDRSGRLLAHHLAGQWIMAVAARPGERFWVATGKEGLVFVERGRSYRFGYADGLPSDEIRDLMVDREGYLWFAGAGLSVTRADEAERVLKAPPARAKMEGQVFPDACAAAKALLKGPRGSGQIALDEVEGKTVVFFNGRPACGQAGGNSHRRGDGALAVMSYDGASFSNYCPRPCPADQAAEMRKHWAGYLRSPRKGGGSRPKALPPVEPVPAETPNREVFLDSRGRLWLGTKGDGLYSFDGRRWARFAEASGLHPDNAIEMVAEDSAGRIWAASSPRFIKGKGYLQSNLHRWDGKRWRHWSPDQGLGYWTATSLLRMKNGAVAVGTNGGLSILSEGGLRTYKGAQMSSSHFVYSLSEDAKGRLWITHYFWGRGVTVFDGGSRFKTVDSRDGLFADRLKASAHDEQGRVWLLADDGKVGVYDAALFGAPSGPILVEAPE